MTIEAKLRITAIVDQAVKALRQVSAEAGKVNDAAKTSGDKPFVALTDGANSAANAVKKTTAETQSLRAANKAAAAEAAAQATLAEKQRLKDAAAARNADAKAAADAARQKLEDQKANSDAAAAALRQQRNEARQLAPQITDIVVGLSTGQSPFTVLLQQGGQLSDVFGGLGNAMTALRSVFTATRVAIGGVAAAIGLVAFEAVQGALESDALNKTLALTGNIAGTSAGQLDAMAKQISTSTGKAIGDVRATLTGLVATGEFTGTTLGSAGRAAVALSKLTGETAEDTIKQFDGMSQGVAAFAAKSNRAYNFLSIEQYKYIQSLEAQGRTQEAMKVTLDALASTMEQRSIPALGSFERGWNTTKQILSSVLDFLKGIGRETTAEERINDLQKKLNGLRLLDKISNRNLPADQQRESAATKQAAAELDAAAEVLRLQRRSAAQQAAQAQETQEEIERTSKGYQSSLAQIAAAGAQQQLAQTLAALDRQQSALELSHAKGLESEESYTLGLNAIDQKRLEAQAANIQRQIKIEGAKGVGSPDDVRARDAALKSLDAQLTQVRSQIASTAAKGEIATAQFARDDAQYKATEWAQIWQNALQQIQQLTDQNGAAAANGISDPVERAAAEASAQTLSLRRLVAGLQRDLELKLSLTVKPGQRAELQSQIQSLAAQSKLAIDQGTREGLFASYSRQLAELQADLQNRETEITQAVDAGQTLQADGERQLLDLRKQQIPNLERILDLLQAQAATPGEQNQVASARNQIKAIADLRTDLEKTAESSGVNSIATALSDIQSGAKPAKDALLDMVGSFAKSMQDVLNRRLAEALVRQFETAAQGSSLGSFFGKIIGAFTGTSTGSSSVDAGSTITATYAHTGAVIGASGGANRRVAASVFDFAPRYHSGGIAGLRPRERATVLMDGEEVLTEEDPRHINNIGSSSRGSGGGGGGDMIFPITINGLSGDDNDKRNYGEELVRRIRVVALDLITEQSRQGGILAKR